MIDLKNIEILNFKEVFTVTLKEFENQFINKWAD